MDFIVCLSLLGYCFAFSRFSKQPIEYAPFFVISSVIVLLYFFAYWHYLAFATDCILIAGIVSLIFFSRKMITAGAIISLLFLSLFLLLAHAGHFSKWDEFTHWGPHSKLVFLNNGFLKSSDVVIHKSYPLGGALFQYLFFHVSGFSEGSAYFAQCLLMMAPLVILIQKYEWCSWQKTFIAYAFILLVFLILRVEIGPTQTLYMDDAVGIYFGLSIVTYLNSRKNIANILYLIPVIAALTLFKQKLFPFVLMIAIVILVDQLIFNRKKIFLKLLAIIILPITSILVTHSWHQYLSKIGAAIEWKINLSFNKIHAAFFTQAGSTPHIIITNYLHALTPAACFVVFILFLNIISYRCYQIHIKKINMITITVTLFLGFITYLFGLLLMYLFSFGGSESIGHASMERYLNIYYIAWSLVTLYFLFDATQHFRKKYLENSLVVFFATALIVFPLVQHKNHVWQLRQPIAKIADTVKKITGPRAKIFTIWQNSSGFENSILLYELTPRIPNLGCTNFGRKYTKQDSWTCNISPIKLKQQFGGFNYLLLAYVDQNFWKHYQTIFPNRKNIKPFVTYRICMSHVAFDPFEKRGCHMQQHHAYLFKIINNNGYMQLKNIPGVS